jgi:succinate dehydrogenase flavin-adding protein (antitoxin of CptAB toxin-antitoxin module)
MKELDLLLTRYLSGAWQSAATSERIIFEQFLELPDPLIAAYLIHGEIPEDCRFCALVGVLRCGQRA